jgi:PAS domain S-box-containing protein
MPDILSDLFSTGSFMPHGHCYLWNPALLWTMAFTDTLIGVAYIAIATTLYGLVRRIQLPFSAVVLSFGIFIAACGATHLIAVIDLWKPFYWSAALLNLITALASVSTGVWLFRLRAPILAVAEGAKLAEQRRVELEALTTQLEARVQERTAALERANEELRTQVAETQRVSSLLNAITTTSTDGIYVKDLACRMVFVNPAARTLIGKPEAEILGHTDVEFLGPDGGGEAIVANDRALMQSGQPMVFEEWVHAGSSSRLFLSSKVPHRSAGGDVIGLIGISRDITDRKRAQEETERSRERLEQAVQARDNFLSIASHELKTPLTSLKLQIQTMTRSLRTGQPVEPERVGRLLDVSNRQLDRITRLVDDMLDVSRVNVGKLELTHETVNLTELLAESTERFNEGQPGDGGLIQLEAAPTPIIGRGDRFRLEQVFSNLLSNAIKYGAGKPVRVAARQADGVIEVRVQDQGIGIAPEHQTRIFGRFERAVGTGISGLGLGLFIARYIVEAHAGSIRVESQPGSGATFVVQLPETGPSAAPSP